MKKTALVYLAEGFEPVEAITIIDYLRRAEIEVTSVSTSGERLVKGAHGITVQADRLIDEVDQQTFSALVVPGGSLGAQNLAADRRVLEALRTAYQEGRLVTAICAGPTVLNAAGVLKGHSFSCYPGIEELMDAGPPSDQLAVVDRNILTGAGPAATVYFAGLLIETLQGKDCWQAVRSGILLDWVEEKCKG